MEPLISGRRQSELEWGFMKDEGSKRTNFAGSDYESCGQRRAREHSNHKLPT
jgi:hypothetical protein